MAGDRLERRPSPYHMRPEEREDKERRLRAVHQRNWLADEVYPVVSGNVRVDTGNPYDVLYRHRGLKFNAGAHLVSPRGSPRARTGDHALIRRTAVPAGLKLAGIHGLEEHGRTRNTVTRTQRTEILVSGTFGG